MQSWKIKRMSVHTLESHLDTIDLLMLNYLGKADFELTNCPLCSPNIGCKNCLWWIIERMDCENFAHTLYPGKTNPGPSHLRRNLQFTKWKKARIKQLTHWRRIIVKELVERYIKEGKSKGRRKK